MSRVILIGYFNEIVELCDKCGCSIIGVVDAVPKGEYNYLGNDDFFRSNYSKYIDVPLVITPDNPSVRNAIYDKYKALGFIFKTLISPEAIISNSAIISEGCMIQSLCNISSNVYLGRAVRVNTGANIMHDAKISDYSVVAPNATILGRVKIGYNAYIGANSTILPNMIIGNSATVGAGAVVTKNVQAKAVVVGVPARILSNEIIKRDKKKRE
jgi:sugar O-acyltransferase (sialic acid O-acetyltransferase NeuD family)